MDALRPGAVAVTPGLCRERVFGGAEKNRCYTWKYFIVALAGRTGYKLAIIQYQFDGEDRGGLRS